jgi:transposase
VIAAVSAQQHVFAHRHGQLNDVDPRAWLADVLARIADHPASRLHELLPWNWNRSQPTAHAA